MTQLSKQQSCLVVRNGIEVWLDSDKAAKLRTILATSEHHRFITFEDRVINTADITGLFTPADMDEHSRRKNGQWKCNGGNWHDKGEKCQCASLEEKDYLAERKRRIAECDKCKNGFVETSGYMVVCECIKDLN